MAAHTKWHIEMYFLNKKFCYLFHISNWCVTSISRNVQNTIYTCRLQRVQHHYFYTKSYFSWQCLDINLRLLNCLQTLIFSDYVFHICDTSLYLRCWWLSLTIKLISCFEKNIFQSQVIYEDLPLATNGPLVEAWSLDFSISGSQDSVKPILTKMSRYDI